MRARRQNPGLGQENRKQLQRRSFREWAGRGLLALGVSVVGIASLSNTLSNVIGKAQPELGHVLSPGNGRVAAAAAREVFSISPASDAASRPAQLARQALRNDPTAVEALSVLGLQAQLRNEEDLTDKIFAYSTAISRRELEPQLWAIEKAVSRGDIVGALDSYNVALRTSRRAREMLFPVLAQAISQPKVRGPLLDIMARDTVWKDEFIDFAAQGNSEPRAMAQLFQAAERCGLPIRGANKAEIVKRLVLRNEIEDAWAFYKTFRPEAVRERSRDPAFQLQTEGSAPFDWVTGDAQGLSAVILARKEGGLLDFSVPTATRATVVSQTQVLPAGSYRLEGLTKNIDQPDRSRPYWSLRCVGNHELGRVEIPNSDQSGGQFSGSFTVPPGCPMQTLSLVTRASDRVTGVSGQIERVQLAPADIRK